MMNRTIFLAKQKYECKHLALYITFTYIKFMLLLYCRTHVSSRSTNFCLVVGQGNSFPLNGKHKDFVLKTEDVHFSTNIKFLRGGGGGGHGNKFHGQLQVLLYLPKSFLGEKQSRPDLMME